MSKLKQLIKEFRDLESKLNSPIDIDDTPQIQFEQKCYKDMTKLLDTVEILVETVEGLDSLQYHNPNVREDAYNKGVHDAKNRLKIALQLAEEKVLT